jgi:hypothetical protein
MSRISSFLVFCLFSVSALAVPPADRETVPLQNWEIPSVAEQQQFGGLDTTPLPFLVEGAPDPSWMQSITADATVPSKPSNFTTMVPCRVVDTRNPTGAFGGPAFTAGQIRTFTIPAGPCGGIPATATAYSLNITVTNPSAGGWITAWPTGATQPFVSNLNYLAGQTIANAAIVPGGTSGAINVYSVAAAHVIIDINGFYQDNDSGSKVVFGPSFTNFGDVALGTMKKIHSISINAPAAGAIVVEASGYMIVDHVTGQSSNMGLNLFLAGTWSPTTSVFTYGVASPFVGSTIPTATFRFPFHCIKRVAVGGAGSVTIDFVGEYVTGGDAAGTNVAYPTIVATYEPIAY